MTSVKFAIDTDGYHWSFWKNAGGWMAVLAKYKPQKPKENKGLTSFKVCIPKYDIRSISIQTVNDV